MLIAKFATWSNEQTLCLHNRFLHEKNLHSRHAHKEVPFSKNIDCLPNEKLILHLASRDITLRCTTVMQSRHIICMIAKLQGQRFDTFFTELMRTLITFATWLWLKDVKKNNSSYSHLSNFVLNNRHEKGLHHSWRGGGGGIMHTKLHLAHDYWFWSEIFWALSILAHLEEFKYKLSVVIRSKLQNDPLFYLARTQISQLIRVLISPELQLAGYLVEKISKEILVLFPK